jgi:hypothetical protein
MVPGKVTIRARAFADGCIPSAIVKATYSPDPVFAMKGDLFEDPVLLVGTNGSHTIPDTARFKSEEDEPVHISSSEGGDSVRGHSAWFQWTAPGSGSITFASSSDEGFDNPTGMAVYTGDTLTSIVRIAYATALDENAATPLTLEVQQGVTYRIVGMSRYAATFTLAWSGDLTVAQTETSTTPVPIPFSWLNAHYPNQAANAADYEALAFADSDGDGYAAWAEYVANSDPTNALSRLTCGISIGANGEPVITVHPETARDGFPRILQGKAAPTDAAWTDLAAPAPVYRFYRVRIAVGE